MKTILKQTYARLAILLAVLAFTIPTTLRADDRTEKSDAPAPTPAATTADAAAKTTALPDAPTPDAATLSASSSTSADAAQQTAPQSTRQPQQIHGIGGLLYPRPGKYSTVVQPEETFHPLSPGEKMIYSIRESVSPGELTVVVLDAGFNHLINGDPKYGSDSTAFLQRMGAIGLRQATMHVIGDGIYASVFHQDERYFRKGPGTPFKSRAKYVLASIFLSRGNNGNTEFDASGILGRATGSALTMAYYPSPSANGRVVAKTFGFSLLGELGANTCLEFWPDVWLHLFPGKSKQ
jgi:hypothetical protein